MPRFPLFINPRGTYNKLMSLTQFSNSVTAVDARLGALAEIGIGYYIKIRNEGEGEDNYNSKASS